MNRILQLKSMIAETGDDCFLQHALGLEYVKIGEEEDARLCFERVLSIDPHYVGTYYHLAKLYERMHQVDKALSIYTEGMDKAKQQRDGHAYNELRSAYDELVDE